MGGGEVQVVWTWRLPYFLYTTHCHDLFYKTIQFHENNPDGIQNREHCSFNNQGKLTQKVCKHELSFLYATHRHGLFYITIKCHDNKANGIQVTEQTQNGICNNQGGITQKVWKQELSSLSGIHCHDLLYITVKYHDYIPKGIQVTELLHKLHLKQSRGNNSESMKARVVIPIHNTSSWPVLHNC